MPSRYSSPSSSLYVDSSHSNQPRISSSIASLDISPPTKTESSKKSLTSRLLGSVRKLSRAKPAFNIFNTENRSSLDITSKDVELSHLSSRSSYSEEKNLVPTLRTRKSFYGLSTISKGQMSAGTKQALPTLRNFRDRFRAATPSFHGRLVHSSPINIPSSTEARIDRRDDPMIQKSPDADIDPLNERLLTDKSFEGLSDCTNSLPMTPNHLGTPQFSPLPGAIFTLSDNENTPVRTEKEIEDVYKNNQYPRFRDTGSVTTAFCLKDSPFKVGTIFLSSSRNEVKGQAMREVSSSTASIIRGQDLEDPFGSDMPRKSLGIREQGKTVKNGGRSSPYSANCHNDSAKYKYSSVKRQLCNDDWTRVPLELPDYLIQNFREQAELEVQDEVVKMQGADKKPMNAVAWTY